MLIKLMLTIFLLTGILSVSASAQTTISAKKQSALRELVSLVNSDDKAAEEVVHSMNIRLQASRSAVIKSQLDERTDLTAAERQTLEDAFGKDEESVIKRSQDKYMQQLDYNELLNEIAYTLYDKYYTFEEIKDLNAFYKTPTGQKALKLMSPIMAETTRLAEERVLPKMLTVLKELTDENKAEIEQKINAEKPAPKQKVVEKENIN